VITAYSRPVISDAQTSIPREMHFVLLLVSDIKNVVYLNM